MGYTVRYVLILILIYVCQCTDLEWEIENTKQLIQLYQQKLKLLQQLSDGNSENERQKERVSSIFKNEQRKVWKIEGQYDNGAMFIEPKYIASGRKVFDVNVNISYELEGEVICSNGLQVIAGLGSSIVVYGIKQVMENEGKGGKQYKIKQQYGHAFWHRAAHFQDQFVQYEGNKILLTNVETLAKRTFSFKSDIIQLFSINQYKIMFVTRYHYGILNVRSLHLTSQYPLSGVVESANYQHARLHILLKNHTLLSIIDEKVVSANNLTIDVARDQSKISLIDNYLILHSDHNNCFHIFQWNPSLLQVQYVEQMCVPSHTLKNSITTPFKYQFFKIGQFYRFLFGYANSTKMYQLNLISKEPEQSFSFPWRYLVVAVGVISFMIFRRGQTNSRKQKQIKVIRKDGVLQGQSKRQQNGKRFNEMALFLQKRQGKKKQ